MVKKVVNKNSKPIVSKTTKKSVEDPAVQVYKPKPKKMQRFDKDQENIN